MTQKLRIAIAMKKNLPSALFDEGQWDRLEAVTDLDRDHLTVINDFDDPAFSAQMANADYLLYGWKAPKITAQALNRMPNLKGVIAAQGSAYRDFTPEAVDLAHERGIIATNVQVANSVPVAEYCLGVVLLESRFYSCSAHDYRNVRGRIDREAAYPASGTYGKTIGIVTATARIARNFMELLRPFDFRVLAWSRHAEEGFSERYGVETVDLDELFRSSDIVSIHTPGIPATAGMITAHHLGLMKDGALLINSARGSVVDHAALEKELVSGRIRAVLDVTDPDEPLRADSPLWDLENVVLTPHIAGSMGSDLKRMGESVVQEFERIAAGETVLHFEPNPID